MNLNKKTIKTTIAMIILSSSSLTVADEMPKMNMHDMNMPKMEMSNSSEIMEEDVIYVCPMHSEIMSEDHGICSICGMDLVKTSLEEE